MKSCDVTRGIDYYL